MHSERIYKTTAFNNPDWIYIRPREKENLKMQSIMHLHGSCFQHMSQQPKKNLHFSPSSPPTQKAHLGKKKEVNSSLNFPFFFLRRKKHNQSL